MKKIDKLIKKCKDKGGPNCKLVFDSAYLYRKDLLNNNVRIKYGLLLYKKETAFNEVSKIIESVRTSV